MQPLYAAMILAAFQTVASHSIFTTLFVNDINQGDGTCVRMPMSPNNSTFPIYDLTSNDMACGYDGTHGVARVCPVPQGAKLAFQWREWADDSRPGSIDGSHKGPCAVYMKAVSSAIKDPGDGSGWFKIWESGYDSTTNQWCTEVLIKSNGLLSIDIPSDIVGGYYLVRPELLALHQADKTPPNPQFYTGCAQVFLSSGGTAVPPNTVSIPGYVHDGDKSVTFNIYEPVFPYPMPGPAPYISSTQSNMDTKEAASVNIQIEGLEPAGCVLINANWCGIELESYNSMSECWNASTNCWNQASDCYNMAPPTGTKNCHIWENKCNGIQKACDANDFAGPPNMGKNLNPTTSTTISTPVVVLVTVTHSRLSLRPSSSAAPVKLNTYGVKPYIQTIHQSSRSTLSTKSADKQATSAASPQINLSDGMETVSYISTAALVSIPALSFTGAVSLVTNTYRALTESSPSQNTNTFTIPSAAPSIFNSNSNLVVSANATCGADFQTTCEGSIYGSCCSQYGWCGRTPSYCSDGCQAGFGSCGDFHGKMKNRKLKKYRRMAHRPHE